MDLPTLKTALLQALLINYAILLLWFVAFVFGHDLMYRLHTRWFRLSTETFDAIHYGAMAVYKIGVLLLLLVPWLVLCLQ